MAVMVFLALCFILAQTSSGVDSAGCEYHCISCSLCHHYCLIMKR